MMMMKKSQSLWIQWEKKYINLTDRITRQDVTQCWWYTRIMVTEFNGKKKSPISIKCDPFLLLIFFKNKKKFEFDYTSSNLIWIEHEHTDNGLDERGLIRIMANHHIININTVCVCVWMRRDSVCIWWLT